MQASIQTGGCDARVGWICVLESLVLHEVCLKNGTSHNYHYVRALYEALANGWIFCSVARCKDQTLRMITPGDVRWGLGCGGPCLDAALHVCIEVQDVSVVPICGLALLLDKCLVFYLERKWVPDVGHAYRQRAFIVLRRFLLCLVHILDGGKTSKDRVVIHVCASLNYAHQRAIPWGINNRLCESTRRE